MDLHYGSSYKIVTTFAQLHAKAGQIPDPYLDPSGCHKALTAHTELLSGEREFLLHSNKTDKEASLYSILMSDALVRTLPDRLRVKEPLFSHISVSSVPINKQRYIRFVQWVADTIFGINGCG